MHFTKIQINKSQRNSTKEISSKSKNSKTTNGSSMITVTITKIIIGIKETRDSHISIETMELLSEGVAIEEPEDIIEEDIKIMTKHKRRTIATITTRKEEIEVAINPEVTAVTIEDTEEIVVIEVGDIKAIETNSTIKITKMTI
jgi:hypothetical protein